ncbi:MAG: hypothetical protein M3419_06375 [Actinomycetota bacterium]|nr:hypothetical protein [Actinomycetota bacterium]
MPVDHDDEILHLGRKAWGSLELLHVVGYFAPETQAAYEALGLKGRAGYFASRSAPMGEVDAPMTVATFYVFAPRAVASVLPQAWSVAPPEQVTRARYEGVAAALHRIVGDVDVDEAVALVRTACGALTPQGRPLYAAHTSLPWPDEPLMQLWHAATLVREHRGDGHVAALVHAGVGPLEALVLNGLAAGNTEFLQKRRGWTSEEWADTRASLREQGLLDGEQLSADGQTLVAALEVDTERAAAEGWAHLGAEGTARLVELVTPLRRAVLADEHTPHWLAARR